MTKNQELFKTTKKAKLDRMLFLRIFNMLGMIRWEYSAFSEAEQKLRFWNPLVWVWLFVAFVSIMVTYIYKGFVEFIDAIKEAR